MTPFALLLDRCGLSHREAAAYLSVRLDTVRSWSLGRNRTPPGVIEELRLLYRRIELAAVEWRVPEDLPPGAQNAVRGIMASWAGPPR